MYTVLEHFTDLQDSRFEYNPGDTFPREGLTVSNERLKELSTDANKRRRPVIELVKEPVKDFMPEPKEPTIPDDKPRRGRRKKNAD